MAHGTLASVAAHIREQSAAYCEASKVPGYLAGVYHDGDQTVVAYGTANVATGAPMRDDTGFLFGSVTKALTTTLVLQQVERRAVDLDERVVAYLPEFRLAAPSAAEEIRIRHLLSHTNGIDADLFLPDANGRGALQAFLEGLGRHCGALFAPGEYVSYSNGGMIVAGRLLEVVTGASYHELLEREVFAPVGMDDSCTSAEDAILRSTAVGHFFEPATTGATSSTFGVCAPEQTSRRTLDNREKPLHPMWHVVPRHGAARPVASAQPQDARRYRRGNGAKACASR